VIMFNKQSCSDASIRFEKWESLRLFVERHLNTLASWRKVLFPDDLKEYRAHVGDKGCAFVIDRDGRLKFFCLLTSNGTTKQWCYGAAKRHGLEVLHKKHNLSEEQFAELLAISVFIPSPMVFGSTCMRMANDDNALQSSMSITELFLYYAKDTFVSPIGGPASRYGPHEHQLETKTLAPTAKMIYGVRHRIAREKAADIAEDHLPARKVHQMRFKATLTELCSCHKVGALTGSDMSHLATSTGYFNNPEALEHAVPPDVNPLFDAMQDHLGPECKITKEQVCQFVCNLAKHLNVSDAVAENCGCEAWRKQKQKYDVCFLGMDFPTLMKASEGYYYMAVLKAGHDCLLPAPPLHLRAEQTHLKKISPIWRTGKGSEVYNLSRKEDKSTHTCYEHRIAVSSELQALVLLPVTDRPARLVEIETLLVSELGCELNEIPMNYRVGKGSTNTIGKKRKTKPKKKHIAGANDDSNALRLPCDAPIATTCTTAAQTSDQRSFGGTDPTTPTANRALISPTTSPAQKQRQAETTVALIIAAPASACAVDLDALRQSPPIRVTKSCIGKKYGHRKFIQWRSFRCWASF
jgi:hypothetical protein